MILVLALNAGADTQAFTIVNDSQLNTIIAQARANFLAAKPYITRLDATILVPGSNGTWKRGSYNSDTINYPASCVKLPYMAAAMYWCRTNGKAYNYLDWCVRPMIVSSDNVKTGDTVDQITGAPNYSTSTYNSTFWTWYNKRLYTENFLSARGLLENQTMMHKTYPTNSGSSPSGAELLASNHRGGNKMQPKCSASLMLEIIKGAIEPGANAYMRELLNTGDLRSDRSVFGFGLPPGTLYQNKLGLAYDTLEDIAYIQLPSGQEFILAAYSNGFTGPEPSQPLPWDASVLGLFAEMVIDQAGFAAACPPKKIIDNASTGVTITGSWALNTNKTVDYDMYGGSYRSATSSASETARITWSLNPPSTGKYEVCVWTPQKSTATTITYTVVHAGGSTNVSINQTKRGGRWVPLGNFNFNAGQGSVYITNKASTTGKVVMADAVKITKFPETTPPAAVIVDNTDPGFSASTNWWASTSVSGYYGSNYHTRGTAAVSDAAKWTVTLPSDGTYKVYARWTAGSNRASSAPYVVTHVGGSATVRVNQQANGGTWQLLGSWNFNQGTAVRVQLSCWTTAGYYVVADAVKFEK